MSTFTEREVREIFERVMASPRQGRAALLEELSRGDKSLRAEVASLLEFSHTQSGLLGGGLSRVVQVLAPEAEAGGEGSSAPVTFAPGSRVGEYEVVRALGEGGMAVVYEALQVSPRRHIALKVLRRECATPDVASRFRHEANALAALNHPGIAKVFDAGEVVDHGRETLFIAMELVEGLSIRAYVERDSPSRAARIELLAKVCDAVHHAHQRGVIHRDLKSSNIMVDALGEPKVLDFGVARLTLGTDGQSAFVGAPHARPVTLATTAGQIIGTVSAMSPEQAGGDPGAIDVRTDVYALGVLLYETLLGEQPVKTRGLSITAALRAIAEQEPVRPSVVEPTIDRDLELMLLHALEKEPGKRYQSAAALGMDLRKFLRDDSISIREPTVWEQTRRFSKRHKAAVAGVAGVTLALVAGIGATSWQAVRATREKNRANREALVARENAEILNKALTSATPEVAQGKVLTARDILASVAKDLENRPSIDPEVAARTRLLLAESYASIGDVKLAELFGKRAWEELSALKGESDIASLRSLLMYGNSVNLLERGVEAEALARRGMTLSRARFGDKHQTVNSFRQLTAESMPITRKHESLALLIEAYDCSRELFGTADNLTIECAIRVGNQLMEMVRPVQAIPIFEAVCEYQRAVQGPDNPETVFASVLLMSAYKVRYFVSVGDPNRAAYLERSLALVDDTEARCERVLGPDHPYMANALAVRAALLSESGDLEGALGAFGRVRDINVRTQGGVTPRIAMDNSNIVGMLRRLHRPRESLEAARENYEVCVRFGVQDSYLAAMMVTEMCKAHLMLDDLQACKDQAAKLRGTRWEKLLTEIDETIAEVERSGKEAAGVPSEDPAHR